jgi:hypothetical protein
MYPGLLDTQILNLLPVLLGGACPRGSELQTLPLVVRLQSLELSILWEIKISYVPSQPPPQLCALGN